MFENQFINLGGLSKHEQLFKEYGSIPLTIKKGSYASRQSSTNSIFYLMDGTAKSFVITEDGEERIFGFLKKGSLLSLDCLAPGSEATASVVAVTDLTVILLTREQLQQMTVDHPDFSYDFINYFSMCINNVVYYTSLSSISNHHRRLISFLRLFFNDPEFQQTRRINMTQEEIAHALCMSRAQLAKILAEFRQDGLIETGNRYILINRPENFI